MDKLLEFGRKAWFVVRVISGYEERKIRSYRLQLQRRIEQAQARKVELKRLPEKAILAEVRRMVEEMQNLNRQLEETETAIEEYFKPIDKDAEMIINLQLEKEENQMKEMIKAMREQSMLQRATAMEPSEPKDLGANQPTQPMVPSSSQPDQTK
ncbi:uncharacterized protein LOC110026922 [Phalaenopsis equestris]|uniref:uncharacterized protein LOC110026922 n=1 Tax=Phalaenopsis equestris TaxID=78828 RepID=UPI0009E5E90E|nr:uncharacterized protein LOC110026922 [Phalaenopsis equestris]XP_020583792.1 uncharacterized protein LOC110026922 [Phalaenopsis equestris]XP_020583793.1 uncharacterized protein LOC110026922 [Phalaenopsis equestris]XP_020583794.1 uncharacterized protein LOC110026922 [Phalaenopsis equestris]